EEDRVLQPKPEIKKINNSNVIKIAVIGAEDDVVLEKDKQLEELKRDNYKIFQENIGHDIPIEIKLKYYNKFCSQINLPSR
ncbi:hypothetical protein M3M33_15275, partial [Loigolactobacillus coryniformis]|uniref:hypothetical protein n=1 Tax=Loigolactobacillus coryniformis TaxID=1610 RepID=UPI00201A82C5